MQNLFCRIICLLALSGLLASLEESRKSLFSSDEEYGFLSNMLRSKELHALFQVHNKIQEKERNDRFNPVLSNAMNVVIEVLDSMLPDLHNSEDLKDLFFLLQKPHFQVINKKDSVSYAFL